MRCRIPREYVPVGRPCASCRFTVEMAQSTASGSVTPCSLAASSTKLAARHEGVEGVVLQHDADAAVQPDVADHLLAQHANVSLAMAAADRTSC